MIRIFFGSPGCGKTTLACYMFYKNSKKKKPRYSFQYANFQNDLSVYVSSLEGLGSWTFPEYSYIVIDEAGIEYNSRKYKTLDQSTIAWFKLHRHYKCDVDFISQSWEDTDITIRRLADELWYIKKLGPVSLVRRVYKSVSIDENTHQIIDAYRFGKLIKRFLPFPFYEKTWFLVWRPKYYKYFDTHAKPNTPVRFFIPELDDPSLSANEEDGLPPAGHRSDRARAGHAVAILKYMRKAFKKFSSRAK